MAKFYLNGMSGLKGIDLPQYPDEAWDWISNAPETETALYNSVAFMYRAVQLTAGAVADMPFAIVSEASGEDVDVSTEWKNKLGFMPNPNRLMQLLEMSIIMYGKGYLFRERNKVRTLGLRYISPSTVEPRIDGVNGLIGFRRAFGPSILDLEPQDLLYFWEPDPRVELGPPMSWRFTAMLDAAGLLKWYDYFVTEFAKRGGVLPTMLMVKGIPSVNERDRMENYWDKFMKGAFRVAGKIFNAEVLSVATVGEGPKEIGEGALTERKREDIAVAAGIPLDMLLSNAANYATANVSRKNWITQTVLPDCHFIAGVFNAQLLGPLGMRMEYRPETLNEFQEEEAQRAGAWKLYVDGGMKKDIAAQVVGIEPPPGVEFDDMFTEEPEDETPPAAPAQPAPEPPMPDMEEPEDEPNEDTTPMMGAKGWKDLETWRRLAMKAAKNGKPADFVFTTTEIPPQVYQTIAGGLQAAHDVVTVAQVFDKVTSGQAEPKQDEIKALLEGIKLGVEALKGAE
jgi:hypothetical protein